jgi:hypothetical protein
MPKTFWFLAIDFVIGKCPLSLFPCLFLLTLCLVYANSFLATLNTRRSLRDISQRTGTEDLNMSGLRWASGPTSTSMGNGVISSTLPSSSMTSSGAPHTPVCHVDILTEATSETVSLQMQATQPITINITKERVSDSPYAYEGEEHDVSS